MNYLKSIAGTNFKGRSFFHELAVLTAICGKNMKGKSAIRDALILTLIGHVPRHGKQPKATWGYAGGRNGVTSLAVAGTMSDGSILSHELEIVKTKLSQNSKGGPFPFVPLPMMDVRNEFLSKSGPAKVEYIFDQINIEDFGFTTEKVTARLKTDVKPKEITEQSEAALSSIVDDVENLARERDEFGWKYQEWLNRVTNRITEDMDAAQAIVDQMAGLIQGGTQLRAQDGLQGGQNVEAELSAARTALQDSVTAKQVLEGKRNDYAKKTTRKRELTAALEGTQEKVDQLAGMEITHDAALKDLQAYQSNTLEVTGQVGKLETGLAIYVRKIADLGEQIEQATTKLAEDLKAECCPHCKSKGKTWKKSLKESTEAAIADLQKALDAAVTARDATAKDIEPLRIVLNDSKVLDKANDQKRAENFALGQKIKELRQNADRWTQHRTELAGLNELGENVTDEKLTEARVACDTARAKVAELEQLDRQRIASMQDAKRAEQARQSHDEKKIEVEVRKLALKVLKELRVELMDTAYKGFMSKVNLFTSGIMPGELEYRDGDIGYFAGATWVGLDYFSGTEEMLTLIGLSIALTQKAKFKIVFVDEWLRDEETRMTVPARLADLIAQGVIDQAIVIDTRADGYDTIKGCKVINIV